MVYKIETILHNHAVETRWHGGRLLALAVFGDGSAEWEDATDWTIADVRTFLNY